MVGLVESGELLADRPEARIQLLADTEGLGITSARMSREVPSPPLHVHDSHTDCFLVLGGAVLLRLGGEERLVESESWIHVPRGVVHTFAAGSETPATFVNVHAPSHELGTYMRGLIAATSDEDRRCAWDAFDARAVEPDDPAGVDPATAVVCRLGGDEGETITDRPGRRLTLLADTEDAAATESVYGPGERGPEPHVHRKHTDVWVVLEGTLTFRLAGEHTFEVEAETLVVVPPNVVHEFWNEGEVDGRFLNLHAPSCGFGEYLRGRNPDFDQHDPPADGGADPASAYAVRLE